MHRPRRRVARRGHPACARCPPTKFEPAQRSCPCPAVRSTRLRPSLEKVWLVCFKGVVSGSVVHGFVEERRRAIRRMQPSRRADHRKSCHDCRPVSTYNRISFEGRRETNCPRGTTSKDICPSQSLSISRKISLTSNVCIPKLNRSIASAKLKLSIRSLPFARVLNAAFSLMSSSLLKNRSLQESNIWFEERHESCWPGPLMIG